MGTTDFPSQESHGRLPWLKPSELSAEQLRVYNDIAQGRRATGTRAAPITDPQGRLQGPFNSMLFNPQVGGALQELGEALRFATGLTGRQREICILLTAVHCRSEFEWLAHTVAGKTAGLTGEELDALHEGTAATTFDEAEQLLVHIVRSLTRTRDLDDITFARGVAVLGIVHMVEIVTLVGYYELLARNLQVFRVPLPEGRS